MFANGPRSLYVQLACTLLLAVFVTCSYGREDDDPAPPVSNPGNPGNPGNPTQWSLNKPWYYSDYRLRFDEATRTYELANFIGGFYQLTELGTYDYTRPSGVFRGYPQVDLMGGLGLSDNGAPFIVDLVELSNGDLMLMDRDGDTSVLTQFAPALERSPISDDFSDGRVDKRWWMMGDTREFGGEFHLRNPSAAVGLFQRGFRRVQATIRLDSTQGPGNISLGYRAWDENLVAKCGVSVSEEGDVSVFAQVHDEATDSTVYYKDLLITKLGVAHECRMEWTGSQVNFYCDGVLGESYAPPVPGNFAFCGAPCVFAWRNVLGAMDNFVARD